MRIVFLDGTENGQAFKRAFQIDFFAVVADFRRAVYRAGSVADDVFRHLHHAFVVGEGFVEFDHGEFRVVAYGHALVTEAAVDFKHAFQTADNQAFQIQFGSDAQVEWNVQGIVVGNKRFRCCTARNRVHHWGFNFQIMLVNHEIAYGLDDLAAFDEGIARFFVGNQIDVALTVFGFLIAQTFVFVRQRAQGFGQQADVGHAHSQFAVVGFEQSTFRADDVAQVPVVEVVQNFLAHAFVVQIKLDLTSNVLNGGKAGFAHLTFEHHAAGNFDGNTLWVEFFFADFTVLGMQVGGKAVAFEIVRVGVAFFADVVQFLAAQGDDLVFVQLRLDLRIVLFAHGVFRKNESGCRSLQTA